MKLLVTGANGFLGHHLVQELLKRRDHVQALVLPTEDATRLRALGVTVFVGDIRRPETLIEPIQGVDSVFHLAALMGLWRPMEDYRAVNVLGTENICRAALKAGVKRFVHISSAMVYRLWAGIEVAEEGPLAPLGEPYATTKAEGDRLVQRLIAEEGLPAVIMRPSTLFGPGDRTNFGRLADRVRSGRAVIIGSGDNPVPWVYVSDVVDALLLALDAGAAVGQAYNIANDRPLTQLQLLSAVAEEIDVQPPRVHVPYHLLLSAALVAERVSTSSGFRLQPPATRHGVRLYGGNNRISIDKARRDLGYAPRVELRDGIRLTADWYTKQVRQHDRSAVRDAGAGRVY